MRAKFKILYKITTCLLLCTVITATTLAMEPVLKPIETVWTQSEKDISKPRPDLFGTDDTEKPSGYNFRYTGWGQDSYYGAYYTTLNTTTDVSGEPITETKTKEADVMQFLLTDTTNPDGPDHTAYCVDLCTGTKEGWWYKIDNLETAGYYPNASAENHIRAIALHGYWGTASGTTGSLTKFQEELENAKRNGNQHLAGLDFTQMTEGEAQAATQMAIWQYGNRYPTETNLTLEASNYNGSTGWSADESDKAAWDRINAAAAYLADLSEGAENTTVIITPDTFVKEVTLTPKERIDNTGAYNVDLDFTLAVTPDEKDSMTVSISQDNNVIATQTMIAGQTKYTVKNLTLYENQDINFEFSIKGFQYLKQGVYIYTSESRDGVSSQTLVGIAEGHKAIDVNTSQNLHFNIEETNTPKEPVIETENTVTTSKQPSKNKTSKESTTIKSPQTGDASAWWYITAVVLSGFGIIILTITRKKLP